MPATRTEVDQLEYRWLQDPCFDLVDAANDERFAPYKEELERFQRNQEEKWATAKSDRLTK